MEILAFSIALIGGIYFSLNGFLDVLKYQEGEDNLMWSL